MNMTWLRLGLSGFLLLASAQSDAAIDPPSKRGAAGGPIALIDRFGWISVTG